MIYIDLIVLLVFVSMIAIFIDRRFVRNRKQKQTEASEE